MKTVMIICAALLILSSAEAQESKAIDRISATLGQCIGSIEVKNDEARMLQAQNVELKRELDALKASAGKKDDKTK